MDSYKILYVQSVILIHLISEESSCELNIKYSISFIQILSLKLLNIDLNNQTSYSLKSGYDF